MSLPAYSSNALFGCCLRVHQHMTVELDSGDEEEDLHVPCSSGPVFGSVVSWDLFLPTSTV
jgi:hypothetical protein